VTETEYETVLGTVRDLLNNTLRQNERLIKTVAYYADGRNWTANMQRNIARVDRGRMAQRTIKEIWGIEHKTIKERGQDVRRTA
jgi:hypothetical protein